MIGLDGEKMTLTKVTKLVNRLNLARYDTTILCS